MQDYLLSVLDTLGIDAVVAEELTRLPGAEEVAALLELRSQVESGPWDLVVVDCAPTAETLRLLALPEALAWHLDRLLPGQRGLIRSLRPAAAAAAGVPLPGPEVLDVVTGWNRHLRAVQRLLTGEHTSVRLVLTPERVVIAESRRTWTSLSPLRLRRRRGGRQPGLPGRGTGGWLRRAPGRLAQRLERRAAHRAGGGA